LQKINYRFEDQIVRDYLLKKLKIISYHFTVYFIVISSACSWTIFINPGKYNRFFSFLGLSPAQTIRTCKLRTIKEVESGNVGLA